MNACVYVRGGGEAEVQLVCIYWLLLPPLLLTVHDKLIAIVLLHEHIFAV